MSNSLTRCTKSSSAAGGRAPAWLNTSLPLLKAISVGIDRISAAAASCCWASVSTLAYTTSGCCSEEAANVGANARHGPHHDAQKSTSTISLSVMVSLNCSAVRSRVATMFLTLGQIGLFPPYGLRKLPGDDQRKSSKGPHHDCRLPCSKKSAMCAVSASTSCAGSSGYSAPNGAFQNGPVRAVHGPT